MNEEQKTALLQADPLAGIAADQARKRENKAAAEQAQAWIDDLAVLEPVEWMEEEIDGVLLSFRCPRFGQLVQALGPLQEVYAVGREILPEGSPADLFKVFLTSWDSPKVLMSFGDSVAKLLDLFLEQDPGFTAKTLSIEGVARCVRNFIRVTPVGRLKAVFFGVAGAVRGLRQQGGTQAKSGA